MKLLLAIVALVGSVSAATEPIASQSISSTVVDVIEGLRDDMPCGFPGLGIPPLAPLRIEHKEVDIDTSAFKLRGNVDHFRLNGLNDFDIEEMKINAVTSKATYKFLFRNVNVDTTYDLSLFLKKFGFTVNLVGNGHSKFAIKNMAIWGTLKYSLGLISGKLKLKSLDVRTHIGEVESEIEGILGEGAINQKMNDYLAEAVELAVNENEDLIASTIEATALPIVNDALADISLTDLITGNDEEKQVCIPPELEW